MIAGTCVREEYCRDVVSTSIDAHCIWSDESDFVDGPPDVAVCPETEDPQVPFCGGPCGACPTEAELDRYSNLSSCAGLSERRGFGVCAFNGNNPCRRDAVTLPMICPQARAQGKDCACLLLQLPDGSFQEVGFPTLDSSCLAYQAHFPDTVRCMDPYTWTPLEP